MLVIFFVFCAVAGAYPDSRRKFLTAEFAEEVSFGCAGESVLVIFRIGTVASTHAGGGGKFIPTELTVAGLLFIGLSRNLVFVIRRIGAVARADGAGISESLAAELADKVPVPVASRQNMLVVFRISAVTCTYAGR